MNALKKSSELWHTSVNRKARPVVEGEHNKSWKDHVLTYVRKFSEPPPTPTSLRNGQNKLFPPYLKSPLTVIFLTSLVKSFWISLKVKMRMILPWKYTST